jgi:glycosyltransferase involved in cell wall biosynthesis
LQRYRFLEGVMKILHVIDSEGYYGAETVLVNLAVEQKKQKIKPVILNLRPCPSSEQSLELECKAKGLEFKVIHLKPGYDLSGAFKIVRYANDNRFSVIHSHGYKPNILLGFMPKIIRKIPIVSTLHGWTSTDKFSKIWLFEQLDLLSLRFMDAVVVVSQAMREHPWLKKSRLNLHVVSNGIPDQNLGNLMPDEDVREFCSDGFVIGAIGRLSREKGFEYLIESLNQLIGQDIGARLAIIGEGPERVLLEERIMKDNLQEHVLLAGYRKEARNYIPLFNVFVISSLTEGLPITLLEAMQARVPVVATRVGGIPKVLGDGLGGYLIDPCSADQITAALVKYYADENIVKKKTDTALQVVRTDYSAESMALKYAAIYTHVIRAGDKA